MISPIEARQLVDALENYVKTLIQEQGLKTGIVHPHVRADNVRNKLLHRQALHDAVHALNPVSVRSEPPVAAAPEPTHKPPGTPSTPGTAT